MGPVLCTGPSRSLSIYVTFFTKQQLHCLNLELRLYRNIYVSGPLLFPDLLHGLPCCFLFLINP